MRPLILLAMLVLVAGCASAPRTGAPAPVTMTPAVTTTPAATGPQYSYNVSDAQTRLHAMGLYNGPIDGLWGPATQAAVENFQRNRGAVTTGRLDGTTLADIRRAQTAVVTVSDATDVRTVQNRLSQLNLYNGPADGVWNRDTQAAVERFQQQRGLPAGAMTEATVLAMGLNPNSFSHATAQTGSSVNSAARGPLDAGVVRGVQQRLHENGFYTGRVDGIWGPATSGAVSRFQQSRGLQETGDLNPATASALGLDPNNLAGSAAAR